MKGDKVKRIFTKDAMAGNVLARDVYGFNDTLILKKGTELTAEHIYSLMLKNINGIDIEEDNQPGREQEKHYGSYRQRFGETEEFKIFNKKYSQNIDNMKMNINNIVEKNAKEKDIKETLAQTMDIIRGFTPGVSIFDMLNSMKVYDDSTFSHCVNVALICNVFAKWLGMDETEITLATECGLFHDIGKVLIPLEVLLKPGKLTSEEYDLIKTHTVKGYEILKDYDCFGEDVKLAALMHHEKCDGSGYPLGVKGDKINKYAKIVAIADIYDAMTSARVYRGPLCPFKVIRIFEEEGFLKYEPEYIMTFLRNVADTYMQNDVILSDGRRAKIVFINKNAVSRPIVECEEGFVDLSKETNLSIENII